VRSRIFEPFFTTKEMDKGTGLGLAMVYGIIKNHNGFVEVESKPKQGATFRLYLPVETSGKKIINAETVEVSTSDGKRASGQRTVLLAEDEEAMVWLLKKTLSNHGYNLLVALDGQEALELYDHHKHEIAVLVLDIGLPKIAGWDVIRKVKEDNPRVAIVVSSGYIDPEFRSKMRQAGVTDFLNKPYTTTAVLQTLQAVFERADLSQLPAGCVSGP
jgi:two-component system, cell cycle sensor histidine kinase and response regulator CckA